MGDHLYGMLQHIHAASCFSHHASNAVPGEPRVAFGSLAGVRASDNVAAAESTVREKLDGRNILVVEFDQRSTGASSTRAQCRVHVGRTELLVHLPFVQRLGEFFTNPLNKEPLSLLDPAPAETHHAASQSSSAMDVDVFFRHTVVTLLNHVLGPNMPLLNLTLKDATVAVAIHECEQDVLQKNGVSYCEKPASLCKEKEKGDPGRTTVGSSHMMIDAHLPIECLAYNQEKLTYDTLLEPVALPPRRAGDDARGGAAARVEARVHVGVVRRDAALADGLRAVAHQLHGDSKGVGRRGGGGECQVRGDGGEGRGGEAGGADLRALAVLGAQRARQGARSARVRRLGVGLGDGDAMPVPVGATEALRFFRHYEIEGHGAAAAAAAHHPTSDRSGALMLTDRIGGDGLPNPAAAAAVPHIGFGRRASAAAARAATPSATVGWHRRGRRRRRRRMPCSPAALPRAEHRRRRRRRFFSSTTSAPPSRRWRCRSPARRTTSRASRRTWSTTRRIVTCWCSSRSST